MSPPPPKSVNFEDFILICTVFPHFGTFFGGGGVGENQILRTRFYGHPDFSEKNTSRELKTSTLLILCMLHMVSTVWGIHIVPIVPTLRAFRGALVLIQGCCMRRPLRARTRSARLVSMKSSTTTTTTTTQRKESLQRETLAPSTPTVDTDMLQELTKP